MRFVPNIATAGLVSSAARTFRRLEIIDRSSQLEHGANAYSLSPLCSGPRWIQSIFRPRRFRCISCSLCGSRPYLLPLLLQKNPHGLKVKRHRVRLEEIVADHAGERKAEGGLPRKRAIVETRDVLLRDAAEGEPRYRVGNDLQGPTGSCPAVCLVFLELDPGLPDDRVRQLDARACEPGVDEQERRRQRLHPAPRHHEVVARDPERSRDALA